MRAVRVLGAGLGFPLGGPSALLPQTPIYLSFWNDEIGFERFGGCAALDGVGKLILREPKMLASEFRAVHGINPGSKLLRDDLGLCSSNK